MMRQPERADERSTGSDLIGRRGAAGGVRAERQHALPVALLPRCRAAAPRARTGRVPQRRQDARDPAAAPVGEPTRQRRYSAAGADVGLPEPEGRYPLDPHGLPIHGAMPSLLRWALESRGPDRLAAALDWDAPELLALFPYVHRLRLSVKLSDRALTVATVLTAGRQAVPVSFGWHPYFVIPGIPRAQWRVTLARARSSCSTTT